MRGRGPPSIALGSSYTLRFIVLLAIVFVATEAAQGWFGWRGEHDLLLSMSALDEGRVWTVVTSALMHADVMHLLFNALGLWYFGKLAEESLGSRRYAVFLALAAILSHVPFIAAMAVTGEPTATIGASGIVMAVLVFAAFRFPGMPFSFWFLPMKLWQLAVLYVVLDVAGVASGRGPTDHWTHLGGAVFGLVVHKVGLLPKLGFARRPRPGGNGREPGPYRDGNVRGEIDRILDKINSQGIGSLSDEEREFLKRNSGKY
jgi:membrane associated rhomboid family serine protease